MPPRFVADSMLGRLAKWLRAFGFDVFYDPSLDDHGVVACARERGAVAFTRDTGFPEPPGGRVTVAESVAKKLPPSTTRLSETVSLASRKPSFLG